MVLSTRIDSTQGPVTSTGDVGGLGVERNTQNRGFGPFKVDSTLAVTGSSTLLPGDAGIVTLSSGAAITEVLPLASACPGATFIFRSLSAQAHILTASQETGGTKNIVCPLSTSNGATSSGNKFTFGSVVGNSVVMQSDGLSFHILSYSGSFTLGV